MSSFIICKDHQVKEDEMNGHAARTGEKINIYEVLIRKPEGKNIWKT
jgi:hypothetical protein